MRIRQLTSVSVGAALTPVAARPAEGPKLGSLADTASKQARRRSGGGQYPLPGGQAPLCTRARLTPRFPRPAPAPRPPNRTERAMVRETQLTPANLIWPLFVCPGDGVEDDHQPARRVALVGRPARCARAMRSTRASPVLPHSFPMHGRPAQRGRRRSAQSRQSDVPRDRGDQGRARRCDRRADRRRARSAYTSHGQDGLVDRRELCPQRRNGRGAGRRASTRRAQAPTSSRPAT